MRFIAVMRFSSGTNERKRNAIAAKRKIRYRTRLLVGVATSIYTFVMAECEAYPFALPEYTESTIRFNMTDTAVAAPAPVASSPAQAKSPKKKSAASPKAKKAAPTHPTTAVMVIAAIKELKEKKGSSLPAIKKYLAANYKVDAAKLAPFIRKFLKSAVTSGKLVQTKGNGASGHFKLAVEAKKEKAAPKKKPVAKKATASKAPGAAKKRKSTAAGGAAKKAKSGEPAAKKAKKVAAAPKPKAAKPKKSPAKAKKAPATKAKAPKAKKVAVKKAPAPKKK